MPVRVKGQTVQPFLAMFSFTVLPRSIPRPFLDLMLALAEVFRLGPGQGCGSQSCSAIPPLASTAWSSTVSLGGAAVWEPGQGWREPQTTQTQTNLLPKWRTLPFSTTAVSSILPSQSLDPMWPCRERCELFFFFWFQVLSSSAGDHSQLDRASPQRVGRILQESNNPVIAVKTVINLTQNMVSNNPFLHQSTSLNQSSDKDIVALSRGVF